MTRSAWLLLAHLAVLQLVGGAGNEGPASMEIGADHVKKLYENPILRQWLKSGEMQLVDREGQAIYQDPLQAGMKSITNVLSQQHEPGLSKEPRLHRAFSVQSDEGRQSDEERSKKQLAAAKQHEKELLADVEKEKSKQPAKSKSKTSGNKKKAKAKTKQAKPKEPKQMDETGSIHSVTGADKFTSAEAALSKPKAELGLQNQGGEEKGDWYTAKPQKSKQKHGSTAAGKQQEDVRRPSNIDKSSSRAAITNSKGIDSRLESTRLGPARGAGAGSKRTQDQTANRFASESWPSLGGSTHSTQHLPNIQGSDQKESRLKKVEHAQAPPSSADTGSKLQKTGVEAGEAARRRQVADIDGSIAEKRRTLKKAPSIDMASRQEGMPPRRARSMDQRYMYRPNNLMKPYPMAPAHEQDALPPRNFLDQVPRRARPPSTPSSDIPGPQSMLGKTGSSDFASTSKPSSSQLTKQPSEMTKDSSWASLASRKDQPPGQEGAAPGGPSQQRAPPPISEEQAAGASGGGQTADSAKPNQPQERQQQRQPQEGQRSRARGNRRRRGDRRGEGQGSEDRPAQQQLRRRR